jgi:Tol biopolymer transport system component
VQTLPGRLAFTISGADPTANGLWAVDGDSSTMTRLNSLPSNPAADTVWVPDSSGLLFIISGSGNPQAARNILYIAANGSQHFSLTGWLGNRIADFHWVNP